MAPSDDDLAAELGRELGGTVLGLRRLSGGASRITSSFELEDRGGARRELILQLDRSAARGFGNGVRLEAALLGAARRVGIPVAAVVATGVLADGERGWLVVGRLDGETIPRRLLRDGAWAAARGALTAQCGTALASIHAIDPDGIDGLPRSDPLAAPLPLLDTLGEVRPVLELGVRWLARNAEASSRRVLVHGDFRMGNLLVGPDGLRAVLDWELAHVGDPAEDVGWLCARSWRFGGRGHVGGFGELDELLAAYERAGGEHLAPARVTWWEAYAAVKWATICALQASAHLSGATRSVELATIGRRVCESEWDLLVLLGAASSPAPSPRSERTVTAPFGRPTALELVEAVAEQLDREVVGADGDRARYEARVSRNALLIAARQLELGDEIEAAHAERLGTLGMADDAALAAALRRGALDEELEEVARVLAGSTLDQLRVANPRYAIDGELGGSSAEAPAGS